MNSVLSVFASLAIMAMILGANWYVLLRPERPPRNYRNKIKRERIS